MNGIVPGGLVERALVDKEEMMGATSASRFTRHSWPFASAGKIGHALLYVQETSVPAFRVAQEESDCP